MTAMAVDFHDQIYFVTVKVVPGDIYPIIGHTTTRRADWERKRDLPAKEGLAIYYVGPDGTPRVNDRTHGILAADGSVVAMPLVEIAGGTVNGSGEVDVEILADGEEHVLATLPAGSWVRRVTDAETGGGPLEVLVAEEELTVRAHFPGALVLWIDTHDGRARTVVNVAFV